MKYKHKEAFCLMRYASKDGQIVEWIWNSRDGVTPFVLTARDGETQLFHIEWQHDIRILDYRPQPGERVFVDLTEEYAQTRAKSFVDRWWYDPEQSMSSRFDSREHAVETIAGEYLEHTGAPSVRVFGEISLNQPST